MYLYYPQHSYMISCIAEKVNKMDDTSIFIVDLILHYKKRYTIYTLKQSCGSGPFFSDPEPRIRF